MSQCARPLRAIPRENGTAVVNLRQKKGSKDWHEVHVTAQGGTVSATVNGQAVDGIASGRTRGYVGIQHHHRGNKVEVSELRLKPLSLKPIFNGENLDGWNTIPGRPSKFSVIDGALNIKDGNGQIETAGTYKDFVLQLDIISNGKHLNSGVFFRGPVGVFWKGYESQVRNQWSGDDRAKPVDYGTGGNYGNQAARKVVSTDGEWFQKTVVCDGNHAAVWINGYQVSDFTDTRPHLAEQRRQERVCARSRNDSPARPRSDHGPVIQEHQPARVCSAMRLGSIVPDARL